MDKKEVLCLLTQILAAALNENIDKKSIVQSLTHDALKATFEVAKKHDVAHIVADFVYNNNIQVDEQFAAILKKTQFICVYKYEQMNYAFKEICSAFDAENISYLPLKGAVIRPFYPTNSMRTSCDIDILIHENELESAIQTLEKIGYVLNRRQYHDVLMHSPNNILLELHFSILESMNSIDSVLKDAWQYAELVNGCRYQFKKDFFVFHMYAHMLYHFISGGCGIRSLMDIWVMEHNMNLSYNCAKTLLQKSDIYRFASQMSEISNNCFTKNTTDSFTDLVVDYIYSGGMYGNANNNLAIQKTNGVFKYVLKRMFLPYGIMASAYPVLKKAPFLLPIFWILRWFLVLFKKKSRRLSSEISFINKIPDKKIKEIKQIRSRMGL